MQSSCTRAGLICLRATVNYKVYLLPPTPTASLHLCSGSVQHITTLGLTPAPAPARLFVRLSATGTAGVVALTFELANGTRRRIATAAPWPVPRATVEWTDELPPYALTAVWLAGWWAGRCALWLLRTTHNAQEPQRCRVRGLVGWEGYPRPLICK